jgi:hypothetical protein
MQEVRGGLTIPTIIVIRDKESIQKQLELVTLRLLAPKVTSNTYATYDLPPEHVES